MIMIALVVLSLVSAGLIKYYSTYSTVLCWVVIIAVILFYLVKKFGLEWYVKRKMTEFPVQEIKGLRLGVKPALTKPSESPPAPANKSIK
jgi:membrane protein YdbS with pleckstrin-like domain